ncbi:hypothetical protein LWP59_32190 [Amycolatopsis acidiphila]|uniref:MBL fold metallo-hydrolase n=1 Tax=Amycolatopsis acidiphila TaxID=715473 RepID=A0A557ZXX2_9PSEU|nr:hypothetical protein [Amycolatopsis acidiphila]TVT16868.1 hypothetical protein FNH06_33700 [Amycolatopsis acidiphila]UIJ58715.1 hypothetical protein LWP59_32190 [Amycolatopsis acidiphila]
MTVEVGVSGGETLDFGGGAEVIAVPGHTEGSIQDRARTAESFRRPAALDVDTACFGHGDPTRRAARGSGPARCRRG